MDLFKFLAEVFENEWTRLRPRFAGGGFAASEGELRSHIFFLDREARKA